MNIQEIIDTRKKLDDELRYALASMEKKETIKEIRAAIKKNQEACPHYSAEFNWTHIDSCPYCGKPDY